MQSREREGGGGGQIIENTALLEGYGSSTLAQAFSTSLHLRARA